MSTTTRAERAAAAASLHAEGLNGVQIADRLGVSTSYTYDLLNDPQGDRARVRKRSYAGTCAVCGGETDGSNGRARAPRVCGACLEAQAAERNAERDAAILAAWEHGEAAPQIAVRLGVPATTVWSLVNSRRSRRGEAIPRHHRRHREAWPLIERRWREGATAGQIAAEAGMTKANAWRTVQNMRKAGIDLPQRATGSATHCRRGHEFTPENTIRDGDGGRRCRTCTVAYHRAYRARRRAELADAQPTSRRSTLAP